MVCHTSASHLSTVWELRRCRYFNCRLFISIELKVSNLTDIRLPDGRLRALRAPEDRETGGDSIMWRESG